MASVTIRDVYEMSEKIEAKLDKQNADLMACIKDNASRISVVEKVQQEWGIKTKIFVGVALFVGSAVVWIGDKLYDFFLQK